MKTFIIYSTLLFLLTGISLAQDSYLNKRFVLIKTASNRNCLRSCDEVSKELFRTLKAQFFNSSDNNANWSSAFKDNSIGSTYPGLDFFLTSTIEKISSEEFQVSFILYDSKKKSYYSPSLKDIKFTNDKIVSVAEFVVEELVYFKENAKFKKIILIDDFEFGRSTPQDIIEAEDFSDWLAYELKDHKIIGVSFHVYYYKEFDKKVENIIEGKFKKRQDTLTLRVDIDIKILDKKKFCDPVIINIEDYRVNKEDILDEIFTQIKAIEPID